jgi:hypothetical protein
LVALLRASARRRLAPRLGRGGFRDKLDTAEPAGASAKPARRAARGPERE